MLDHRLICVKEKVVEIKIRIENEKDFRRVEEITRIAFSYPGRVERGGIGCPYEHWMVNELRHRDGYTELSLVATVDEEIVGHIICSKAEVRTNNEIIPVLNIGPISVLPEYQRKGVGKILITEMIAKAKQLLSDGVFKTGVIAEKCGFSNPYHFCRVFKEKTGLTPTHYANSNRIYKI